MRIVCFAIGISLLVSLEALADDTSADSLFREGRRAADAGDYTVACVRFEQSYQLEPAAGTLLNWADCEEHRGESSLALQHFKRLEGELSTTDDRRPIVEEHIRVLEPIVGARPLAPNQALPPNQDVEPRRAFTLVLGGAGAASFLTGTALGVLALTRLSSANGQCTGNVCTPEGISQYRTAQSFAVAADVTMALGLAVLGTALVLYLTAPHDHARSNAALTWVGGQF